MRHTATGEHEQHGLQYRHICWPSVPHLRNDGAKAPKVLSQPLKSYHAAAPLRKLRLRFPPEPPSKLHVIQQFQPQTTPPQLQHAISCRKAKES